MLKLAAPILFILALAIVMGLISWEPTEDSPFWDCRIHGNERCK